MSLRAGLVAALLAAGLLTLAAVVASEGSLAAAVAPALAIALVFVAWRAPLRASVLGLMFLALIADAPQDHPMAGMWRSPLYAIGQLLSNNWSNTFGVAALSFSGMDLFALLLLARVALEPGGGGARTASALRTALFAFFATLVGLAAFGMLRGASPGNAYWQVRQFVFIPVFAWLVLDSLQGREDHRLLGPLVIAAALIKAGVGLYFHFFIAGPRGLHPPFLTTHADTMLFCLSIALVLVRWLERPDPASLRRCLWFVPLMLATVWLNNRRIAWIGLGGTMAIIWQFTSWNRARRALARAALVALPLVAGYVAAGWSSSAPAFKPVAAIRTVVETRDGGRAADSSTRSRQIENFNLAQTLRQHPLGLGLGSPYEEVVQGPDLSRDFARYRYIPHNSVLWMMTAGGPFGFFALWSLFVVGIFLAARSYRCARRDGDRMAALSALCAQFLFLVQAWGDMGIQNWSTTWLVAAALAVSGRLAVETSAWPLFAPRADFTLEASAWTPNL